LVTPSKTLTRTVVLDCYANKYARRALREIESAYREMLVEMVEYAVKYKASQNTLHRVFYKRFRERYPWLPTRVIKGASYRDANSKLRHRIHQWSVRKLIELLDEKPVYVIKVSERGTSSRDPFTGRRVRSFEPLVIRTAVKGLKRVKVMKIVLRVAKVGGRVLERDVVGAINIGLKYLNPDGSPVALGSTGAHEVWVKLVNPHRGPTPLTEIQVFTDTTKYR
jgi:transposase